MKPFYSLLHMIDTLHTEEDCREYLEDMRWHGEPVCPHCGSISKHHYKLKQNGEFIGDDGHIISSIDGITWSVPQVVGSKQWNAVTYGNGKYIAVGDSGLVTTSIDGVTWTEPEEIRNESGNIVWANLNGVCAMP